MASCQLSDLRDRVSRVVVRRAGSARVRIIKAGANTGLNAFLALNAKTQLHWDDVYKCYVGSKPTKCIGTLMVFVA